MIDLSQRELGLLLLSAFLTGIALGIFYDLIRLIKMFFWVSYSAPRRLPSSVYKKIISFTVTFLTDIIFWITAGVLSILLLYCIDGVFRGMIYLGIAMGFLLYYVTVGRLILRLNEKLTAFMKKSFKKAVHIIFIPIHALCKVLISLYHLTIGKIIGKIIRKIKTAREMKKALPEIANTDEEASCGKEDFVYVDGKTGYQRTGRINFGRN